MKIKLPIPHDYARPEEFFDQLELAIYHARKSYEKILAKYSAEDIKQMNDTPYVKFLLPLLGDELDRGLDKDDELRQEIEIEILEM
jgi:hypothetical protein